MPSKTEGMCVSVGSNSTKIRKTNCFSCACVFCRARLRERPSFTMVTSVRGRRCEEATAPAAHSSKRSCQKLKMKTSGSGIKSGHCKPRCDFQDVALNTLKYFSPCIVKRRQVNSAPRKQHINVLVWRERKIAR